MDLHTITVSSLLLFLLILITGIVLSSKFRESILGSNEGPSSSASVFGFLTVKGSAIIVLVGIFVGAIIFIISDKQDFDGEESSEVLEPDNGSENQNPEPSTTIDSIEQVSIEEKSITRGSTAAFFGNFKIKLSNIGNFKKDADFVYSVDTGTSYKVSGLDTGQSIAREIDGILYAISIVETSGSPEFATFRITKVKLPISSEEP